VSNNGSAGKPTSFITKFSFTKSIISF